MCVHRIACHRICIYYPLIIYLLSTPLCVTSQAVEAAWAAWSWAVAQQPRVLFRASGVPWAAEAALVLIPWVPCANCAHWVRNCALPVQFIHAGIVHVMTVVPAELVS